MHSNLAVTLAAAAAIVAGVPGQASAYGPTRPEAAVSGAPLPRIVKFETDFNTGSLEYFSVEVKDAEQLRIAEKLLAGDTEITQRIPSGFLVKEPSSVNPGYNWHVNPEGFRFAEISGNFCNVPPSYVKEGHEVWYFGAYCPRPVKVVAITEAPQ
ncbi:hypothetical protein [Streptomyces sp. NPDC096030]|uniref:BP74-related protein n=1 Tax=Streptomyces sp. NPDC096030 TaxID=3155423 RepID=UPI00332E3C98